MAAPLRTVDIDLADVSYWYPDAAAPALSQVEWRVDRGEFVVVAGPSGSGKSTLLRCLNGLVPHFAGGRFGGVARVGGIDTRHFGPRTLSRHVGFVFQDPEAQAVAEFVEDDIAFGLEQAGMARLTMRKRVEEVLDLLGIAELRRRRLATLSGGERQRVAVASALALQPDTLVLDEPTSQLDPWGAEEVLTSLHRLNEDLGLTIILAEHRLERVAAWADRLAIVRDGVVVTDEGPAQALMALDDDESPPLARLARGLGWSDAPLTIKQARQRLAGRLSASLPLFPERSTPGGAPIVEISNVSAGYDQRVALRNVSLEVRPGEFVAVMGRNGSGKTTLLRTLLGLHRPTAGRIVVAGREVGRVHPADLAGIVGYVPQEPARLLFADRIAAELDFTLRHRPRSCDWPARTPVAVLESLGIAHLADRHHRDISVGERERAALAAVLVAAPRVLVLDEPTRGMDARRKRALAAVLEAERAAGAAIVMATHDVELVAEAATRVVLLGDGEIVADGSPREVLSGSLTFATQIAKLLGGGALTVDDALVALAAERG